MDDPKTLKPIGPPFQLILSKAWCQHIGTLEGDEEIIQATIYGNSNLHVRNRAEKFISILITGKIVQDNKRTR